MTRTHYPKVALAAAIAALGFAAGAIAQASGTASLQGADRTFVMKAAQGGLMEVEAGKAAQQKAQNDSVKQYAQRMVTDHSKANDELASLAKAKQVEVPSAPDKAHQAHLDKLSKLSGPGFDREYMKHMVDDHRKTVADFEKQSKDGKDADVRKWAESKLPTLKEHLKMAQETSAQLSKGGSAKSGDKAAAGGAATPDSKTGGKSDPTKPVNTANPAGNTTGSNTGNTAGAAPKAQTTGK